MRYKAGCELEYEVQAAGGTPLVLNVEAQRKPGQAVVEETLVVSQDAALDRFTMPESGNRYFRVSADRGPLTVRHEAVVDLDPGAVASDSVGEMPAGRLPLEVPTHLYPSRYAESDLLQKPAQKEFGHLPPGYGRVAAICNWIHDNIGPAAGGSDGHTSARDTLAQRRGVCRDFAHLAIAFCRALGIPARFVSAYAWWLSPPDFHAAMEAWLEGPDGGAWFLFDPSGVGGRAGAHRRRPGHVRGRVLLALRPSEMRRAHGARRGGGPVRRRRSRNGGGDAGRGLSAQPTAWSGSFGPRAAPGRMRADAPRP